MYKRRFFALQGKQLHYFKSAEDPAPLGTINLCEATAIAAGTAPVNKVRSLVDYLPVSNAHVYLLC